MCRGREKGSLSKIYLPGYFPIRNFDVTGEKRRRGEHTHYQLRDSWDRHGVLTPLLYHNCVSKEGKEGRGAESATFRTNWGCQGLADSARSPAGRYSTLCGTPKKKKEGGRKKTRDFLADVSVNHSRTLRVKLFINAGRAREKKKKRGRKGTVPGGATGLRSSPRSKRTLTCSRASALESFLGQCREKKKGKKKGERRPFRVYRSYVPGAAASATAPAISFALSTRPHVEEKGKEGEQGRA